MKATQLSISNVLLFEPTVFGDLVGGGEDAGAGVGVGEAEGGEQH